MSYKALGFIAIIIICFEAAQFYHFLSATTRLHRSIYPNDVSRTISVDRKIDLDRSVRRAPHLKRMKSVGIPSWVHTRYSRERFDSLVLEHDDPIYTQFGAWDNAPIVIPEYKLAFFATPKVGCTVFKQLFRRMMGNSDYRVHNKTLPHHPGLNGLWYLYNFSPEDAETILTDPSWTRALFIRDPKKRLLSGYMDKAIKRSGLYLQNHCCRSNTVLQSSHLRTLLKCKPFLEGYRSKERRALVTFAEFVNDVIPVCDDVHWQPQRFRVSKKYWPFINFVGNFDNIANDTRRLLTNLGAWEKFGASGWGDNQQQHIFEATGTVHHATNSSNNLQTMMDSNVTASILALYGEDYSCPLLRLSPMSYFN